MPQYMLVSHHGTELPAGFELTPEMIQGVIRKYNDWIAKTQQAGHLVSLNKLKDRDPGRHLTGFGDKQVVTDGPYAETKEVIGGYWIITAANYDEAVRIASDCPTLEFGGRIEVREVEDLSAMS
ncbi:MAG: transcription initiation protein [Acidobacteria bacterium]|nr:transcription initiation protein [Acidobacteriota bacterium]MBI3424949.1 transcription initiation protein [Acidobacteriota bacterium]